MAPSAGKLAALILMVLVVVGTVQGQGDTNRNTASIAVDNRGEYLLPPFFFECMYGIVYPLQGHGDMSSWP